MPGFVSTLLNQIYSDPAGVVQAFLQGMVQVWQARHLSRFITMAIWALIFIEDHLPGFAYDDNFIALAASRPVIVE